FECTTKTNYKPSCSDTSSHLRDYPRNYLGDYLRSYGSTKQKIRIEKFESHKKKSYAFG
ncbi:hypothetical protein Bpfe_006702, partial [Biomphalaria pfeifferi]